MSRAAIAASRAALAPALTRALAVALALAVAPPVTAVAQSLETVLDTLKHECGPRGTDITDDAVVAIDVTGDGEPEQILDYTHAGCADDPLRPYCGNGGCSLSVFAGGKVHEFLALGWRVYRWETPQIEQPVLLTYVRGYECNDVQAPCVIAWTWAEDRFVSVRPEEP
ncbi:MAG: hypothetical protein AAFT19_08700 [Pseudomonadota bacterium]